MLCMECFSELQLLTSLGLQVALYCDLHGHSRKHGAFMYGCQQSPTPQVGPVLHAEQITFLVAQ